MKAYLIANVTVTDAEAYAAYREQVPAVIAEFGGRYLVRGSALEQLEGDLPVDRLVVVEFPSMEAAQSFYRSPDYAPLLALRSRATSSWVAMAQGYEPA